MSISEGIETALGVIEIELDVLYENPNLTDIGESCDDLSLNYRVLAGGYLLSKGDTDAFYHNLSRSGEIRLYFLKRCVDERVKNNPYFVTGNGIAIFDVLAARNFDLAKKLATLSPSVFFEDNEYEDDFCFNRFFNIVVSGDNLETETLSQVVDQFEVALEGQPSAKLDICKALLSKDQEIFNDAFYALLAERAEDLEAEKEEFVNDELENIVKSNIFIEGLAILNVAKIFGFDVLDEYIYCPRLARILMEKPFPPKLKF